MSLDLLEQAINEVTDKDWSWWPFLWLRPEKHVQLTLARVVSMAILYGLPLAAALSLTLALARPLARGAVPSIMLALPLLFLFAGSVVVAPMWNRRADRLRSRGRTSE
jgi:hypothetical protein